MTELALNAEEKGFESVWISEDPYFRDLFPVAAVLGRSTKRIKICAGIANYYSRHPVYMAMTAATLNEICDGRFVLGLGRNVRGVIEGQLGIHYGNALQSLEEYIQVLRGVLKGEQVTFQGKVFKVKGAKLRLNGSGSQMKIYTSGMGRKAFQLAGRIADGVILNACSSPEHVRYAIENLKIGAEEAGRSPGSIDVACCLWLSMSEGDIETAYEVSKQSIAFLLSIPTFGELILGINNYDTDILKDIRAAFRWDTDQGDPFWHLEHGDAKAAASHIPDELVEKLTLTGSPEDCRRRLAEFSNAGVQLPIIFPIGRDKTTPFRLIEALQA